MAINHIEEIQYYSNASNQARDEWLYGNTFGNSQAFNTMADADELKAFAIFFTALFFICAGATGFPGLFFLLAGFGLKAMASKKEEVKTEAKDLKQYI